MNFDDFCQRDMPHLVKEYPEITIPTVTDWVQSKNWSISKKNKYRTIIHKQLHTSSRKDFEGSFKLMVKSGEVYYHKGDPL